jgi:hypothetical protein
MVIRACKSDAAEIPWARFSSDKRYCGSDDVTFAFEL